MHINTKRDPKGVSAFGALFLFDKLFVACILIIQCLRAPKKLHVSGAFDFLYPYRSSFNLCITISNSLCSTKPILLNNLLTSKTLIWSSSA